MGKKCERYSRWNGTIIGEMEQLMVKAKTRINNRRDVVMNKEGRGKKSVLV